ncbi:MAG: hypothetical protein JST53_07200 [Actinobacteria bacterium]|nr:hypothetical protein [Actinomycetota bacterium]
MRRALVIAGVICFGLFAAAPALSSAAPVRKSPPEREVTLAFRQDGFVVFFDTTDNDGELSAYLAVVRGRQRASYQVPVTITADRVKARFGSLGELDYRYVPRGKTQPGCEHEAEGRAHFEGTFTFSGENDCIHIDRSSADGVFQVYAPEGCAQARRLRRAVPYEPTYSDEGATLQADAGSPTQEQGLSVTFFDVGPRAKATARGAVFAELWEVREGMSVSRGVSMPLGRGVFSHSVKAGTATLRPPAPFSGSAHFDRRGNGGAPTWTGSLAMPILGGEPVELAGPAFRAHLHRGVPQDE